MLKFNDYFTFEAHSPGGSLTFICAIKF